MAGKVSFEKNKHLQSIRQDDDQDRDRHKKVLEQALQALKVRQAEVAEVKDASGKHLTKSQNAKVSMLCKWQKSIPFNLFITSVERVLTDNTDQTISFMDLYDISFGRVAAICHMTYVIDMTWFLAQIETANLNSIKTTVFIDKRANDLKDGIYGQSVKLINLESSDKYGHHHTKMTIIQYEDDSVKFIISSANLVETDWTLRTNGVWISPRCPKLPNGSGNTLGESLTCFRSDLLQYLDTYPAGSIAFIRSIIEKSDCSAIRVFFVASIPIETSGESFGISKMRRVLRKNNSNSQPDWPLTIQCSSIGSLGSYAGDWFRHTFVSALASPDEIIVGPINLIYPSLQNVKASAYGKLDGLCLPYTINTHVRQRWIERYFCQWKADGCKRTDCIPHIKSYARFSPDYKQLAWYLLTSANLSKAAWGLQSMTNNSVAIKSWEVGVLLLPSFVTMTDHFSFASAPTYGNEFPITYDLPPTKYDQNEIPWLWDYLEQFLAETQ